MKSWILAAPLLALVGCPKGEQPQQPGYEQPAETPTAPTQEGQPPAGWEQFGQQGGEQGGQMGQAGGLAEAPEFSEAIGQLRTYAQEIRASQDLQHKDVVAGFNALAAALRTLPNAQGTDMSSVTAYAERLAASDPMSAEHSELVKSALMESVRTLEGIMKQQNVTGMEARLAQIRTQVDAIDTATPLLQQKDAVANSLDQMAQVMDELAQQPPSGTK